MLTVREIAEKFDCSVPQVRRWAVTALGVDPLAGQQMGVPRIFDEFSALAIFLMKHFILDQKLGLAESGRFAKEMAWFAYKKGWVSNPPRGELYTLVHTQHKDRPIYEWHHNQKVIPIEVIWEEGIETFEIHKKRYWDPPTAIDTAPRGAIIIVPTGFLLYEFKATI